MSKQSQESSEYEIAYRSTIQPRTAVRTQSRQSGAYSTGAVSGGGGLHFTSNSIQRVYTQDPGHASEQDARPLENWKMMHITDQLRNMR
uniref:Uncharacterized protein n=1 Tax=Parascaris equorum TaxID=6256 RepID=A0A914R8J8_PAREQ